MSFSRAEVPVLGQPAASVCSKQQACTANFSTTTKYYKRQELIFAVRFLRGAIGLEQSCQPYLWSTLSPARWPCSKPAPVLPSQRQQRAAQTGRGKRNFPVSRAWLIGTDSSLLVPKHQEPPQQGSARYPHNQHDNQMQQGECNHRPRTSDKLEFLIQHAAIFPRLKPSALEESKRVLLFELEQHHPVSQEQVKEAPVTC